MKMKRNENLLASAIQNALKEQKNIWKIDSRVIQFSLEANIRIFFRKNDRSTQFCDCAQLAISIWNKWSKHCSPTYITITRHSHRQFAYDDECFSTIYSLWTAGVLHITKLFTYSDSLAREIFPHCVYDKKNKKKIQLRNKCIKLCNNNDGGHAASLQRDWTLNVCKNEMERHSSPTESIKSTGKRYKIAS